MVSLDTLVQIAHDRIPGAEPKITYPYDHKHAVVILWPAPHPSDSAYIHVDAYSGQVIHDFRWKDFGLFGKAVSCGIALHQGTLFGLGNQAMNIGVALSVMLLAISGFGMWWLRKPANVWIAPPPQVKVPLPIVMVVAILIFSLIVPTAGISFLVLLVFDRMQRRTFSNKKI